MNRALVTGPILRGEKREGALAAGVFPRNFGVVLVLVNRQPIKGLEVFFTDFANQRLGVFFSNMAGQVTFVETNLRTQFDATVDPFHQMFTFYVPLQVARIIEKDATL